MAGLLWIDELVLAVTATMGTASAAVIASLDSGLTFACWFVAGVAYVTLPVACFIAMEVLEGLGASFGHGAVVTVVRIVAVVDVAVEAAVAVKPGAGSDKEAAGEPVRAVVAVGGAIVGGVVEVSVGAYRGDTNVDRDLGGRHGSCAQERKRDGGKGERFDVAHGFS
jgi:hypothetical protein